MQALILVGGQGTRLQPLTLTTPKPAVPLVDRPFIAYMLDWLASHGIDDVIMACGFRAADLRSALGDRAASGARISYLEESEPLGTAGPVRLAADEGLLAERFCVLNGDLLTDIDLSRTIAAHAEHEATATISLHPVDDPAPFGLVRRSDAGEVTDFLEKPDPSEIDTDEVNAGVYVLEREIVERIPSGRSVSIEREVFPGLIGQGVYGVRLDGYWVDIGTPERYLQASWDILEGTVETELGALTDASDILVSPGASVDPEAELIGPAFVGDGAILRAGARVERAVVATGVEISEDATVSGSVLLRDCRLGRAAEVEGSILAPQVQVESGARVPPGSVVGASARIDAGAELDADARVAPGKVAR
ncbi:MAG: NDP-sugar synthase [Solirubrobacterales bacterium]|nr:NDP-sugar synthase [Solirubrobacterales bacterium]